MRTWLAGGTSALGAALALVALAVGVTEVVSGQLGTRHALGLLTVTVFAVCVAVMHRLLWTAVLVAFSTVVVSYVLGVPSDNFLCEVIACLALLFRAGLVMRTKESVLAAAFGFGCVVLSTPYGSPVNWAWLAIIVFGSWGAGRAVRSRRLLIAELRATTAELEASRVTLTRNAVDEERLRIARDIHDVIAHSVTVMLVQAGAAERRLRHDRDDSVEAMRAVQESGRSALVELRQLLGVLRPRDDLRVGPDTAPQPGVAELVGLVAHFRDAGLEVDLRLPEQVELPASTQLTAYRIVQEGLTNVLKHSSAARADVLLADEDQSLLVEVCDAGPPRPRPDEPGGHGLVGMRERVVACGGELEVQPSEAGFRVRARLPLEPVT